MMKRFAIAAAATIAFFSPALNSGSGYTVTKMQKSN